ncbi:MAG: hypothetical protein ACOYO1_12760 [Bacteroidales bacterium]
MTAKKIIPVFFVIFLAVSILLPLKGVSQGYAGPNKTILKDSSVVIGGSGCSGCCYLWTPSTGLSDNKILHPTASPTSTTTYTLKVTGDNFNISDVSQMTVTVTDGLNSITAVPLQCCWKKGDAITADQFTITTDPPGLEGTVTISPTSVPTSIFASSIGSLPITFSGKGHSGSTVTATVSISAVDEDAQSAFQFGMGLFKPGEIVEYIDKIINNVKMGPCGATGGPGANVQFATGKLCCPKAGCIKDMYAYNGTYNYDLGYQCDFPFYGIPYVASLNFRIMASVGASLSLGNVKTTCDGVDICYNIGVTGSIGGGLSGTILGGKLIDASLMLVGTITPDPLEYCTPSGLTKSVGNVCVKADIVGTITTLSFITKSVTVNVISQRCWK